MRNRRSSPQAVLSVCLLALPLWASAAPAAEKVPITTSSDEARQLYLQGRDAGEKLRAADAHAFYEKAVAKDPSFALAYYGLTNTAPTNQAFFGALKQAVALADKASAGEQLMIGALQAGVNGNIDGQRRMLTELVAKYPGDERPLTQLGIFYFGLQDYQTAISYLTKATAIAPNFSLPYNQLGYAYRFEAYWDLWALPEAAKQDATWEMQPSLVTFLVHGLEFDEGVYQQEGHIEVDFGLDTPFLQEQVRLDSQTETRIRANVQKLVEFTTKVEKNSGISGRLLWSESEDTLAQKLIARLQKVQ